jgi:hypothetical protein
MTQKGRFLWWLLMVAVVATSGASLAQQVDYAKKIAPLIDPSKLATLRARGAKIAEKTARKAPGKGKRVVKPRRR